MDVSTLAILILIGFAAGMLSGFVGVGGGIIVVPGLIYLLGMGQHAAQGTSLALMLPPIGILAAYKYWQGGQLDIKYAAILAVAFVFGGYFGAKYSLTLPASKVRLFFGIFMIIVAAKLIYDALYMKDIK